MEVLTRRSRSQGGRPTIRSSSYSPPPLPATFRRLCHLPLAVMLWGILLYMLVVLPSLWAAHPTICADSGTYVEVGQQLGFSSLLYAPRPLLVPLLLRAVDFNLNWFTWIQIVFSLCAWVFLAVSVSLCFCARKVRVTAFFLMLAFSTTIEIQLWQRTVLSESISLSLMALIIGLGLYAFRNSGAYVIIALASAVVLWCLTRDSNVFTLLPAAAIVGAAAAARRIPLKFVLFSLTCVSALALQESASAKHKRWIYPFMNVFGQRILTVPATTRFFLEHGMPMKDDEIASWRGRPALETYRLLVNDSRFSELKHWIESRGKSTYMSWLSRNLSYSITRPILALRVMLLPNYDEYVPENYSPPIRNTIGKLTYPTHPLYFVLFSVLGVGCMIWMLIGKHRLEILLVCLTLLSCGVLTMYVVWHADSIEIARHATVIPILYKLALWLAILSCADLLATRSSDVSTECCTTNLVASAV
jgi:hypothetical protein